MMTLFHGFSFVLLLILYGWSFGDSKGSDTKHWLLLAAGVFLFIRFYVFLDRPEDLGAAVTNLSAIFFSYVALYKTGQLKEIVHTVRKH